MVQEQKRATVNATGCGFEVSLEKNEIFSTLISYFDNKAKCDIEFCYNPQSKHYVPKFPLPTLLSAYSVKLKMYIIDVNVTNTRKNNNYYKFVSFLYSVSCIVWTRLCRSVNM